MNALGRVIRGRKGPAGAPAGLATTAGPTFVVALLGQVTLPGIGLENLGRAQLTTQLEIHTGSSSFTGTCVAEVNTAVDGVTRVLPTQTVSVPAATTTDYDSEVVVDGGGGNTIVNFSCSSVTPSPGTTITPSVTAIT